jgi:hypothetical protein
LVFEVLWSREFVTVFGNSSYAISIILCAYMAGLGLGGLAGGRPGGWDEAPDDVFRRVSGGDCGLGAGGSHFAGAASSPDA